MTDDTVRVPREPTEEMELAGEKASLDWANDIDGERYGDVPEWRVVYRAMVAAAPQPSGEGCDLARIDAMIEAWFNEANRPGATFVSRMEAAVRASKPDAAEGESSP